VLRENRGFTLIELVMIIVIIGVLATVATRKMGSTIETARVEQTKKELTQLSFAIVGNPDLYTDGARTDFGYVGDVGALPPSLTALTTNPGGYSTWNGPYIVGDFKNDGYRKDAWKTDYVYSDTVLRSTGSGSNIDKVFAASTPALLSNSVSGYVVDAGNDVPGTDFIDSLWISLIYPNGIGGTTTSSAHPDANGSFSFSAIPIGNHALRLVYIPDSDTVTLAVSVTPNNTTKLSITFPADLW